MESKTSVSGYFFEKLSKSMFPVVTRGVYLRDKEENSVDFQFDVVFVVASILRPNARAVVVDSFLKAVDAAGVTQRRPHCRLARLEGVFAANAAPRYRRLRPQLVLGDPQRRGQCFPRRKLLLQQVLERCRPARSPGRTASRNPSKPWTQGPSPRPP